MRGIWYILEAVMAVVVMVGFLAAISTVYVVRPFPADTALSAYNMLHGMDNQGLLRNYTESLNYSGISAGMETYTYGKAVKICDYAGSCVGDNPSTNNVWVGTYIVAGLSSYQPREVRLHLWPL